MRALFWIIALFALAVGLIVAARYGAGYLLIVLPPYRIELALSFALLLLAAAFFLGYGLLRVAINVLELPAKVRAYHQRRQHEQGSARLSAALAALFAGRYAEAEQAAAAALDLNHAPQLSAVIAARAAHALKADDRRERYLAQAESSGEDPTPRIMAQAEFLLDEHRAQPALNLLAELPQKHAPALRLELRAQQQLNNWRAALALIEQLQGSDVLGAAQAEELRRLSHAEILKRGDCAALAAHWQSIAEADRRDGYVAATAARAWLACGEHALAREIVEQSLQREWDDNLVALYPDCAGDDAAPLLAWAERQLQRHSGEPALLLALGRLCLQQKQWEPARAYLEASLAREATHSAHLALAQLHEQLGNARAAGEHYRQGLELTLAQLNNSSGGRRKAAL